MTENNLAIVISDLGGGGAQNVVVKLSEHMVKAGKTVTVITLSDAENDRVKLAKNVSRVHLGVTGISSGKISGIFANIKRISALRKSLKELNPDTVLSFIGTTNVLTVLACVGLKKRVIVSERNDPARQSLGCPWDCFRKLFYKRADVVTANSKTAIETMKGFVPENKLVLVPNPVEIPESTDVKKEKIILAVGRLHHQKAYDILLPAFAETSEEWRLVILGEGGKKQELEKLAEELGIKDRVEFKGFVADTSEYYKKARIYVLPSRHEGMSNALLEAAANSLPIIISDACEGGLEFLEDEKSCLVCKTEDIKNLAESLKRFISDYDFAENLGKEAKRKVQSQFDCNKVWKKWEQVIKGSLEK